MTDLSFLGQFADPARQNLEVPFSVDGDGARWACASNGYALLAVRAPNEFPPIPYDLGFVFKPAPGYSVAVPWGRFVAWACDGIERDSERAPCSRCNDAKEISCPECNGTKWADCECADCGDVHDAECTECDATGKVECECEEDRRRPRLGRVGRTCVNRALFAPMLTHVAPRDPLTVHIPDAAGHDRQPISFLGDGWRIIVMPYLPKNTDATGLDLLEIPAEEEVSPS